MHWSAAECYESLDEVARAYTTSVEESWRDRARSRRLENLLRNEI
jgi:hypothetical protein